MFGMIRFAVAAGMALVQAMTMSLTITPTNYHVEFPANPDNSSIVLVIQSDTNSKPYYQYNSVPLWPEDAFSSMDIPRHALPHGGYHITAILMQWPEGSKDEAAVDSVDTIIVVP